MKKKQLVLSVLSTALVASMAASAFAAAPKAGVYIGGNVDKYYSFEAMGLNMDAFLDEMINTVPDVIYVSKDGEAKGGNLAELLFVSNPKSHFVDVTDEMFADIDGATGFNAVKEDGTVESVKRNPDGTPFEGTPGDLKVESVSAIDGTSLKVTFNKEVAAVLPSNFVVTDKADGTRNYVKDAVISADKKSATVTLYDALVTTKTYVVATSNIKDAAGITMQPDTDEFTYVTAIPATIEFKTAKLPKKADLDLDDYVVVKDTNGNELKSGYTVNFTSNLTVGTGNVIDTTAVTSVTVNATITKADGTTITTGNKVFAVEAATAASIETFGLVDADGKAISTYFLNKTAILADGTVANGTVKLDATFKDQYGDDITVTNAVYESLTPTILSVTTTGVMTPVQVGKAFVRVTSGTVSKTIEVEIKANPVVTSMDAPVSFSVVGSANAPQGKLTVTVKDQYGNKVTGTPAVTVTNSDNTVATVSNPGTLTNGSVDLSVQGLKAGTTKLTVKVGDVSKEVTVTATAAGTVNNYAVDLSDETIDLNSAANDATAEIKVYETDAAGNKIKDLTADATAIAAANLKFEPAEGAKIKAVVGTPNKFEKDTDATASEVVVTVKAGTLTLGTVTIKVVDTTDTVASGQLVNPLVKVDTAPGAFDIDSVAKNIKMVTKSGKELNNTTDLATKVAAIDEVISSNDKAVTVSTKTDVAAAVVVGTKETATLTVKFKDASIAPVAFNVEVSDVTAPANAGITITFVDTDTDANQIGGDITFTGATDEADVAKYAVSITNGADDVILSETLINVGATYTVAVPADTDVTGKTAGLKVVVVPIDAVGNKGEAVEQAITDVTTP